MTSKKKTLEQLKDWDKKVWTHLCEKEPCAMLEDKEYTDVFPVGCLKHYYVPKDKAYNNLCRELVK